MHSNFIEDLIDPKDLRLNKLRLEDRAFHDWYRFVLSFPAHLVKKYVNKFDVPSDGVILDPFCGTGTTLVEAKKLMYKSYGIEAHPMAHFASLVKTNWSVNPTSLIQHANIIFRSCIRKSNNGEHLRTLSPEQHLLLLTDSINPYPLHKCLILHEEISKCEDIGIRDIELLAFAYISVFSASNLKFGPEVGLNRIRKENSPVFEDWLKKIYQMSGDLKLYFDTQYPSTECILGDSRIVSDKIEKKSIDAVITSPPYPNEKDYTRTTRLETVLLNFLRDKNDLRNLKKTLIRSNTRNVYVSDDDDKIIEKFDKIKKLSEEIERRRIALNKTSGFERLYHRVAMLYFGGMKRHLENLKYVLKPGAKLAYVVGDQASYLQVLIRTGELLAEIADSIGYDVLNIDLFRTRLSTATGEQLREEVVLLNWNGDKKMNSNKKKPENRYDQLIERIFFKNYKKGANEVSFEREEFEDIAKELNISLPKNLGDIIYSYRYRSSLPSKITDLLQEGEEWVIRSIGKGKYLFAKSSIHRIVPNPLLSKIKILDSTPEIIRRYALNDEQALLAILRYNRLIDIFMGVTCYSLQSHLRTFVAEIGQVETDELYIGVNRKGAQFIFPVQAKGKNDQLGIVQIEQDFAVCQSKFPDLKCCPIAAQFIEDDLIALFEFEKNENEILIKDEKHYKIVPNEDLTDQEIAKYASEE